MANLIIGLGALPTLETLSRRLKEETLKQALRELDSEHETYSPWMCAMPLTGANETISKLIANQPPRGDLVTEPRLLSMINALFDNEISDTFESLPGGKSEWVVETELKSQNPDVVESFRDGLDYLRRYSPFFAALYPMLVEFVVPLTRAHSSGFSSHLARGVIFRSFPISQGALSIAMDLAHELGHQALMTLQSVDKLFESDPLAPVYSEIRHTERPAVQSLHATAALAYMSSFEDELRSHRIVETFSDERILRYGGTLRQSLSKAIRSLTQSCEFTEVGSAIIDEFKTLLRNDSPRSNMNESNT